MDPENRPHHAPKARTVSSQRVQVSSQAWSSPHPFPLFLFLPSSSSSPLLFLSFLSTLLSTAGTSSPSDVPPLLLILPCETVSHECPPTLAVCTGTVSRGSQCARGEIIPADPVRYVLFLWCLCIPYTHDHASRPLIVFSWNSLSNSPVCFPDLVAEETSSSPAPMASHLQTYCYDYTSGLGACLGDALLCADCGCASRDRPE